MQDRTTPNNAAFRMSLAKEIEWYGDLALIMAGCHREASDKYGNTHIWFGLPAAILASISGISAFTQYSKVAGITAFVVAGITGAMSFLNPAEKEKLHFEAGNVLDAWAAKTYLLKKQTIAGLIEPAKLISEWRKLMDERSQLQRQSPRIPTWARSRKLKERLLHPFEASESE